MRKPKIAYYRKLYLAYLIDSGEYNLISLAKKAAMPERTVRASMDAFEDIGIHFEFIQKKGAVNRQGHYIISEWGDHEKDWIESNMKHILDVLH